LGLGPPGLVGPPGLGPPGLVASLVELSGPDQLATIHRRRRYAISGGTGWYALGAARPAVSRLKICTATKRPRRFIWTLRDSRANLGHDRQLELRRMAFTEMLFNKMPFTGRTSVTSNDWRTIHCRYQ
jgi:hypothetical protein